MPVKILDVPTQLYVSVDAPEPELIRSIESRRLRNRKPTGGLWTSTKYTDSEESTSEWIEWSKGNLSKYDENTFYVWELQVNNPCKVLCIEDKSDIIKYSNLYENIYGDEEYEFDWRYIFNELGCDAMWFTETGVQNLVGVLVPDKFSMRSWDVESILWSNWKFSNVEKIRKF